MTDFRELGRRKRSAKDLSDLLADTTDQLKRYDEMFVTPKDEGPSAPEAEHPGEMASDGEAPGKSSSLAADLPDTQDGGAVETTRFQVNVGRDVIRAIKVAAAEDGLRVSQVVDKALRGYLKQRPKS
ncbi:hypothetical protein [Rhizobium hainanense]|uniref:Ribbon-helix-helix protein, copG family n=1 Tax=Rhizobium hainanense TaxID=52131 RepID=A0A1C3WGI5_9HYPH|nr:hypothetical protein [Rhizobium hainanense]SCB39025.1 hypothetical protein GA0061100_11846 [Rhizobium hainanense]